MSDQLTETVEAIEDELFRAAIDTDSIVDAISVPTAMKIITPILCSLCDEIDQCEYYNDIWMNRARERANEIVRLKAKLKEME